MRKIKSILLIMIDIFLVNMSFLLGINIMFSDQFTEIAAIYRDDSLIVSLIFVLCFVCFKMYSSLWDLRSSDEFLMGIGASILAGAITIGYTRIFGETIPLNVCVIATILSGFFIVTYRSIYRVYRRIVLVVPVNSKGNNRVLIVGGGSAGTMIVDEMIQRSELDFCPVTIVDDDSNKIGKNIRGIKIEGNRYDIPHLVKSKNINTIILAIPSINGIDKKEILDICKGTNCKIKIVPGIYQIINGTAKISTIKSVDVEDLLGRGQVELDTTEISSYLNNKVILVTGGGGSIGSELCRQIASFKPKTLIVLDIYENNAYDIQNELKEKFKDLELVVLIGSVRDKRRMTEVIRNYKVDVIFHAAAHKHVPLMEDSPKEAIKNNVFGTYNLAQVASMCNVKKFVLISTDKAVNPTNVMGASKRLCEIIIQGMNRESNTEFVAVRFGNVLGSNGSVIPLFKKQIENGGPVTVTHKNITRFFMLIPEAAQLVLQAGAYAKGGEIFVLDMGEPVKIYDLAVDLIKLSGLEPHKDIEIKITGLRPGEKLYEELLMNEEGLLTTTHRKIFIGKPSDIDMKELRDELEKLNNNLEEIDDYEVREKLKSLVPTYKESHERSEVAITEEKI